MVDGDIVLAKVAAIQRCLLRIQQATGFRNIAVHDYQALSKPILKAILTKHLKDIEDFYTEILSRL